MFEGKILLVDDQMLAANASILALEKFVSKENIIYVDSSAEAIEVIKSTKLSVVFLDIDMPEMSGFSLAGFIEENMARLPYVFLTGYANFAVESYEYNPVDFLIKPVSVERLQKAFDRIEKKIAKKSEQIMIKTGKNYVAVAPEEIQYIYKEKRRIYIHLSDREYQAHATMDELEKVFDDYGFIRCHQSFIIPLNKIVKIMPSKFGQTYEAFLSNQMVVPVSRNKYPALKEKLSQAGIVIIK